MLFFFFFFFLSSADFFFFFFSIFFSNNLSGIPSECQTVWIQIRRDVLSGLIWVQTICKGYQQTTKVATIGERVKQKKKKKIGQGEKMEGSNRSICKFCIHTLRQKQYETIIDKLKLCIHCDNQI